MSSQPARPPPPSRTPILRTLLIAMMTGMRMNVMMVRRQDATSMNTSTSSACKPPYGQQGRVETAGAGNCGMGMNMMLVRRQDATSINTSTSSACQQLCGRQEQGGMVGAGKVWGQG
eukprot:248364-Chlamydomonas_euryale.AAC.2